MPVLVSFIHTAMFGEGADERRVGAIHTFHSVDGVDTDVDPVRVTQ